MIRSVEMDFEYMNYIHAPPQKPEDLYKEACASDGVTVSSWRKTWLENIAENKKHFGDFSEKGIGKLYKSFEHKPMIVMGSGPSLANNIDLMQDTKGIGKISCLHNYHYCEDHGVTPDFYTTLDAGKITIDEISKCGKKTHQEYIDSTKDKTLLAFIGSPPELLKQWKGDIKFFNAPCPDQSYMEEQGKIAEFHTYVSSGGNVLGAATYIAKAFLGCNPIAFTGASFCFSYTKKFYPWDDPFYKEVGQAMRGVDSFGNKVMTWPSYYRFKCFMDYICISVPGLWINCSEGGMLGAYPEGNIRQIQQMDLKYFLRMYSMHEDLKDSVINPKVFSPNILY